MTPFEYVRATDGANAVLRAVGGHARFLGGGTNLVDLMREGIERPTTLIDVSHLSESIEETAGGGLRIGAAARNTAVAADMRVRTRYPMLSRALLSGASAQIRNMATIAGNILQRTRCSYFYDAVARCNKRDPGSGCDAIDGFNRYHAVLGGSPSCVASHPSDLCVALCALDAQVHLQSVESERTIPLEAMHRLPGDTPELETQLQPGDLITAISLPALPVAARSTYRKVRDRSSYAFALVSVAAAVKLAPGGSIGYVRLALGGVGTKPWRARKAEQLLRGAPAEEDVFRAAVDAEFADARLLRENAFKVELARRTVASVLGELTGAQS